ncbi:MAG TPA: hypothetical protein VGM93_09110 [Acidimicrobiales bacterium]
MTAAVVLVFAVALAACVVAAVVGLVVHGDHDAQLAAGAASTGAVMVAVIVLGVRRGDVRS